MKLFKYGLIASVGILGLAAGFYPEYQMEIFLGWFLPTVAGIATIYFILEAAKKGAQFVTKSLGVGFLFKMIYYGATILLIIRIYSFEPIPFIISFAGFFLGLHALEAIIIKDIST